MKKYWAFCRGNIQNTIAYRGPILIWLTGNILSLITIIALWLSASAGNTIGGYTKPELVTYYIFALFLQWLNGWFPFYALSSEIKSGEIILTTLSKPVSLFKRAFAEELGWHLVSVWVGLVASLFLVFCFRNFVHFDFFLTKLLVFVWALGLSILVTFTASLCLGMLAFWFTEVDAVDSVFWTARMFLGGQGLPISLIPSSFQSLVRVLPFRYMFSFPLEIYFGKLSTGEIILGFLVASFWSGILFCLYRLMWNRGRRTYTAFGQ